MLVTIEAFFRDHKAYYIDIFITLVQNLENHRDSFAVSQVVVELVILIISPPASHQQTS